MNKEVEQLKTKSNEEICALITRLNSQLLESRFKMAAGEIEKTHLLRQIRTTIAQCMYILNTRGYTVSVGSHGIYLIERKDNKINDVTEKVSKLINDMDLDFTKYSFSLDKDDNIYCIYCDNSLQILECKNNSFIFTKIMIYLKQR